MFKYIYKPELVFHSSIPVVQQQNPSKHHKPANIKYVNILAAYCSTTRRKNSKRWSEKLTSIKFTYNEKVLHRYVFSNVQNRMVECKFSTDVD